MERLKAFATRLRPNWAVNLWKKVMTEKMQSMLHFSHAPAHCLYFACVSIEGHGFYGAIAGVLFVLTILDFFTGGGGEA